MREHPAADPSPAPPRSGARVGADSAAPADAAASSQLDAALVGELLGALDRAARGRRLYQENNPVYRGFVAALRGALERAWQRAAALTIEVEEQAFRWEDRRFAFGEGRDSLAQLFYKDGIRQLTLLPGFEEEVDHFLTLLQRVRLLGPDLSDDLVTLLWAEEFASLQYSYVDVLAEGLDMPAPPPPAAGGRIDPARLRHDASTEPDAPAPAVQRGEPTVASITHSDFDPTIYFLGAEELEHLRREVEREWERPLRNDVLSALLDRLEDGPPVRQLEILQILRQLLSAFLTQGDLPSASTVLLEVNALLTAGRLDDACRAEAEKLLRELSDPALLGAFFRSLADLQGAAEGPELAVFLQHLGGGALSTLLRTSESVADATLRERLAAALERLAAQHPTELLARLTDADPLVAAGAARLAGRLALAAAAPALIRLLERSEPALRRAAVEALGRIRSSVAMEGLQRGLHDDDREVRLFAARTLGDLRYPPARRWLDQALAGEALRDAELAEKIAFYEALGAVADAETVARLDRLLNGRRLLGREPPEIRACAALALGRAGTPAAHAALRRALDEQNPIVRNAVNRALRSESAAP